MEDYAILRDEDYYAGAADGGAEQDAEGGLP